MVERVRKTSRTGPLGHMPLLSPGMEGEGWERKRGGNAQCGSHTACLPRGRAGRRNREKEELTPKPPGELPNLETGRACASGAGGGPRRQRAPPRGSPWSHQAAEACRANGGPRVCRHGWASERATATARQGTDRMKNHHTLLSNLGEGITSRMTILNMTEVVLNVTTFLIRNALSR